MSQPQKISKIFYKINGKIILPSHSTIVIYAALRILNQMKKSLGIEAMLEYLDCSLDYIAKTSPGLRDATEEALKIISVEDIYKEILGNEKNSI